MINLMCPCGIKLLISWKKESHWPQISILYKYKYDEEFHLEKSAPSRNAVKTNYVTKEPKSELWSDHLCWEYSTHHMFFCPGVDGQVWEKLSNTDRRTEWLTSCAHSLLSSPKHSASVNISTDKCRFISIINKNTQFIHFWFCHNTVFYAHL